MKINKGTTHVVIVQYAYAHYLAGDIISQHRSYDAADKNARNNSFVRIADIRDR